MNRRSQSSLEFLVVIGFTLTIIAVATAAFFMKSDETSQETNEQLLEIMAKDIIKNIETVYYASAGTNLLIRYEMPDIVQNISVENNHELVFLILNDGIYSEKVYYSNVPVTGVFPETYEETSQISKIIILKNQTNDIIVCTSEFGC